MKLIKEDGSEIKLGFSTEDSIIEGTEEGGRLIVVEDFNDVMHIRRLSAFVDWFNIVSPEIIGYFLSTIGRIPVLVSRDYRDKLKENSIYNTLCNYQDSYLPRRW